MTWPVKVVAGSDHAGATLKQELFKELDRLGIPWEDLGGSEGQPSDYPAVGHQVANRIPTDCELMGLLICGTGLGMSYTANRHRGVRAALCHTTTEARYARLHNDANILVLGSRITGSLLAIDILNTFLQGRFEGGRHERRVKGIELVE